MITPINAEEAFDKIQYSFISKNSQRNKYIRELLQVDKEHLKKNSQLTLCVCLYVCVSCSVTFSSLRPHGL